MSAENPVSYEQSQFIDKYLNHSWDKCQAIIRKAYRIGIPFQDLLEMEMEKIEFNLNLCEAKNELTRKTA